MPIKRFYILGDGDVIGVGLRPALGGAASEFGVQLACENQPEKKRVEVVVQAASTKNLRAFWNYVKTHDIRLFRKKKRYAVTKLLDHNGPIPDWGYYASSLTLGQLAKGFEYLGEQLSPLKTLPGIQEDLRAFRKDLARFLEVFGRLLEKRSSKF